MLNFERSLKSYYLQKIYIKNIEKFNEVNTSEHQSKADNFNEYFIESIK